MDGEFIDVIARVSGGNLILKMPSGKTPLRPQPAGPDREPAAARPSGAAPAPPDGGMSHSSDFGQVRWGSQRFEFSPKQRRVVATLWQSRDDGFDYVLQESLLEEAESECRRVRDLFRDHPAWGTLIVSAVAKFGKIGAYHLAMPGEAA